MITAASSSNGFLSTLILLMGFLQSGLLDLFLRSLTLDICSLSESKEWCDAQSVVAVETILSRKNDPNHHVTSNWRYYLSSHKANQESLPDYVRNHWGIENKMHWVLDVLI